MGKLTEIMKQTPIFNVNDGIFVAQADVNPRVFTAKNRLKKRSYGSGADGFFSFAAFFFFFYRLDSTTNSKCFVNAFSISYHLYQ